MKYLKDELVRGSFILIIMMGFFNILNYVYQISMARMLGPIEYGVLAVLMSIVYIFGVPSEAIQTVIAKYAVKFNKTRNYGKMKDLIFKGIKKSGKYSLVIFLCFSLFVILFFSRFLKINKPLLLFTGLLIFASFMLPIVRGVLQGRKMFFQLGINMVLDSSVKIIASISFVFLGFGVFGAIGGVIISTLFAFFIAIIPLNEVIKSKRKSEKFGNIVGNNFKSLIAISCIVLMYSMDIILAKRVFPSELAGQYAFVSLIAKVIIFSNIAIAKAMFPLTSEKFENKKSSEEIFKKALVFTATLSFIALIFYFLIPETIIKLVSLGDIRYLKASGVLFTLGLGFACLSFSNLMLLHKISQNKIGKIGYGLGFFIFGGGLLLLRFNKNIEQFSLTFTFLNIFILAYIIFSEKWKKSA